jgi:rhodanese-related sulfurtransferase
MKHISIGAFRQTLEAEASNPTVAFINVCTPDEYAAKHIKKVKSLPLDELTSRYTELKDKKTIYIHCRSGNRSKRAIETLEQLGVRAELVNVEGGMMAWESAGFKTASTSSTIPLTQQVFITAGLLILLGCTLTVLHGAIFIVIPGFVGGGLLFAGITGWCGMAVLLSKMPWNRK